jgi:hypothetical protein
MDACSHELFCRCRHFTISLGNDQLDAVIKSKGIVNVRDRKEFGTSWFEWIALLGYKPQSLLLGLHHALPHHSHA